MGWQLIGVKDPPSWMWLNSLSPMYLSFGRWLVLTPILPDSPPGSSGHTFLLLLLKLNPFFWFSQLQMCSKVRHVIAARNIVNSLLNGRYKLVSLSIAKANFVDTHSGVMDTTSKHFDLFICLIKLSHSFHLLKQTQFIRVWKKMLAKSKWLLLVHCKN